MTKQDWKHAIISILIGAAVAFFTTLFQGFLEFLKTNQNEILGGVSSTIAYLIRTHRS